MILLRDIILRSKAHCHYNVNDEDWGIPIGRVTGPKGCLQQCRPTYSPTTQDIFEILLQGNTVLLHVTAKRSEIRPKSLYEAYKGGLLRA